MSSTIAASQTSPTAMAKLLELEPTGTASGHPAPSTKKSEPRAIHEARTGASIATRRKQVEDRLRGIAVGRGVALPKQEQPHIEAAAYAMRTARLDTRAAEKRAKKIAETAGGTLRSAHDVRDYLEQAAEAVDQSRHHAIASRADADSPSAIETSQDAIDLAERADERLEPAFTALEAYEQARTHWQEVEAVDGLGGIWNHLTGKNDEARRQAEDAARALHNELASLTRFTPTSPMSAWGYVTWSFEPVPEIEHPDRPDAPPKPSGALKPAGG